MSIFRSSYALPLPPPHTQYDIIKYVTHLIYRLIVVCKQMYSPPHFIISIKDCYTLIKGYRRNQKHTKYDNSLLRFEYRLLLQYKLLGILVFNSIDGVCYFQRSFEWYRFYGIKNIIEHKISNLILASIFTLGAR